MNASLWDMMPGAGATLVMGGLLVGLLVQLMALALYPRVRVALARWPVVRQVQALRAVLLLPLIVAVLAMLTLLAPAIAPMAGPAHCHDGLACTAHVPITLPGVGVALLALSGLVLLLAAVLVLRALRAAWRVRMLLQGLGSRADERGFLRLQTATPLALSVGLWRPRVALSEGLLAQMSAAELAVVLAHEEAHGRRRDNLLLLGLGMGFPLARLSPLWTDLVQALEMRADAAARDHVGSGLVVAETLLRLHRLLPQPQVAALRAFGGARLRSRLSVLLRDDDPQAGRYWPLVAVVAAAALLVLVVEPLHWVVERLAL